MSLSIPENVVALTPSDVVGSVKPAGVLFVGTGGDVKIDGLQSGTAVLFKNVPNGSWLKVRAKTVYAAGTTADDIVKGW